MVQSEGFVTTRDGVRLFFHRMEQLQREGPSGDPLEFGRKEITWSVEHLPNESFPNVMKHFDENLLPSIRSLHLTATDFAKVHSPVLVVHGTRDRHAPYGGGMDWAFLLPDARLVTIEHAAHLPWIESPREVFDAIRAFLDGHWPESARRITETAAIE